MAWCKTSLLVLALYFVTNGCSAVDDFCRSIDPVLGCKCESTPGSLTIEGCNSTLRIPSDLNASYAGIVDNVNIRFRRIKSLTIEKGFFGATDKAYQIRMLIHHVETVTLQKEAFVRTILHVALHNVKQLVMEDKSFHSCWGTLWILQDSSATNVTESPSALTSSDVVVWLSDRFRTHSRPELTPLQKFKNAIELASRMDRLEIEMIALLAVIGAIIIVLIILTVILANKIQAQVDENKLPDVIPLRQKKKANNPVLRLSKVREKRHQHQQGPALYHPPLPPPR